MSATLLAVFCSVSLCTGAVFHVAPTGDDAHPGTAEAPFATLVRAQQAVRALAAPAREDGVRVVVHDGTYRLDETLVFGPEDGGTDYAAVCYVAADGAKPLISGGVVISGWKAGDGDLWTLELPEVAAGTWYFRQLFVDGERLPRGRYPNDDLLHVKGVNGAITAITLQEALPEAAWDGADAELVMYQNWSISRERIEKVEGNTVHVATPMGWIGHGNATTASAGKPCYVENALALVDRPGEWYLDRDTGVLTYCAAPGEDPNTRHFVAPRVEQLLCVEGRRDAPVRNLHFEGLHFAYAAWALPPCMYLGIQAGHHGTTMEEPARVLPLSLAFLYTVDCFLEDCRVAHVGASAIGFGAGCRFNRVRRCIVEDVGGNGIMTGWRGGDTSGRLAYVGNDSLAADWKDPSDTPTGNRIEDNTVRRCGAVNHGAVGIFDAFCAETQILHNEVHAMPYTGISVGFRWDTSSTSQRDTRIEGNHVYDVMGMLADGGSLYTLGLQPGTAILNNCFHDVHRSAYAHGGAPNNGIFFDQGSKGYFVSGNVIYGTHGKAIRFNQTNEGNLAWGVNYFDAAPGGEGFPEGIAEAAGPR